MRCHHHGTAASRRVAYARQRRTDARVVGDGPGIVLRNVEIGANEHALVANIDVCEPFEIHCAPVNNKPMRRTSSYSPSSFLPRTFVP
jgi:hypothetical protein